MKKLPMDAVVFDLDGVITQTAMVHSAAWEEMFNEFLQQQDPPTQPPFSHHLDYLPYIDGKPRYEGVRSFLFARGIELPFGSPQDAPGMESICALGNRKNQIFNQRISAGEAVVFSSTLQLIGDLKAAGVRLGIASSSRNCALILETTGLIDLFQARVDGVVSAELGLKGKPAPDIFTTAADRLGARYDRTVVIEDAVAGVQAGRAGNFGLVIGVSRENNQRQLLAAGADWAVADLEQISLHDLEDWFTRGLEQDAWSLIYHDFPEYERTRESLLAVGNGYFGSRGAMDEAQPNGASYPATYLAGVYNRLTSDIAGRQIENEDLVNCPNWHALTFRIADGDWYTPDPASILEIERKLDLRRGVLERQMLVEDHLGRQTRISSYRLASMADPHLAAQRYELTPLNYEQRVTLRCTLDGAVRNAGVPRYQGLSNQHFEPPLTGHSGAVSFLQACTTQSRIQVTLVQKVVSWLGGAAILEAPAYQSSAESIAALVAADLKPGVTLRLDRLVSIESHAPFEGPEGGLERLENLTSFEAIGGPSAAAWEDLWRKTDIEITGDRRSQRLLRLHSYHLLVSASPHSAALDVAITARGLHGEAYRGHIFWDELYIFPFLKWHFPQIVRAALLYRYRRLDAARQNAREAGYAGALYPWQSGSSGREETQVVHLNPLSGNWGPDHSSRQRHVQLAIAYNLWDYYQQTDDLEFMTNYGLEMLVEICRFWASLAQLNPETEAYDLPGVMGPDEFHEQYPGAESGGLTNNAYTNLMVSWLLRTTIDLLNDLGDQGGDYPSPSTDELGRWSTIAARLELHVRDDGVWEQFRGFFGLKELDWEALRAQYGDIRRLDRILKAGGESPDDYQALKQADALVIFYILSEAQVREIIKHLGRQWLPDTLRANYHYYLVRTSHGSTLSTIVHAYLAHLVGEERLAWEYFEYALGSDYADLQGGTTGEGIHTGVMGGTLHHTLRVFGGLSLRDGVAQIHPALPAHWRWMKYRFNLHGKRVEVELIPGEVRVRLQDGAGQSVTIVVGPNEIILEPGTWTTIRI